MSFSVLLSVSCAALAAGFLISWLLTSLIRRMAVRMDFVDQPGQRKVHDTIIPLGGGLAIWASVLSVLAGLYLIIALNPTWLTSGRVFFGPLIAQHRSGVLERLGDVLAVLGLATAMMSVGLVDDWRGLGWPVRLGLQIVAALIVACGMGWRLTLFVEHQWITTVLTVFWIVGLVNSFNMLDNMDGLSAGLASISSAMLAVVLLMPPYPESTGPQLFVAGFLWVLVGSLLGFLCHNFPRARIFMGDAGSYFVGFCIAIATLLATYTRHDDGRPYMVLAPLCVLAVPLYDTITVIGIRLRAGRSPFEGDQNHLSHRLVSLGMSKAGAVGTIYLLTFTCGLGAWLLGNVSGFGAAVILLIEVCILVLIGLLEWTALGQRQSTVLKDAGTKSLK